MGAKTKISANLGFILACLLQHSLAQCPRRESRTFLKAELLAASILSGATIFSSPMVSRTSSRLNKPGSVSGLAQASALQPVTARHADSHALVASSPEDAAAQRRRHPLAWVTAALLSVSVSLFPIGAQDVFTQMRHDMVDLQIRQRGIVERDVLHAMEQVPRHLFVPDSLARDAYDDRPVEITPGQTLSQSYVSAIMLQLLKLKGDERVLEIGTGTGYDAALLSRLAAKVYTIEIDPDLGQQARSKLGDLGYDNIDVKIGDGYHGWPEKAPFDAILLTAAPERIPEPLLDQLAVGGRMVVAVGFSLHQDLQVITKTSKSEHSKRTVSLINLSPMTGQVTEKPAAEKPRS